MELLTLKPENVIAVQPAVLNVDLVAAYIGIYGRGNGNVIPRIVVAHRNYFPDESRLPSKGEYLILAGNHHAIASAIMVNKVYAIETESDDDLQIIERRANAGSLDPWPYTGQQSIVQIMHEFKADSLELTLDTYVRNLVSSRTINLEKGLGWVRSKMKFQI